MNRYSFPVTSLTLPTRHTVLPSLRRRWSFTRWPVSRWNVRRWRVRFHRSSSKARLQQLQQHVTELETVVQRMTEQHMQHMESDSVGSSSVSVSVQCDGDMVTNPTHELHHSHHSHQSHHSPCRTDENKVKQLQQLERADYNCKIAPFSPRDTPCCRDQESDHSDSDQEAIVTLSEGEGDGYGDESKEDVDTPGSVLSRALRYRAVRV